MNGLSSQEKRILQWSLSARAATTLLMLVTSRFVSPFDDSAKVLLYSGQSASGWLADLALPFLQWDTLHFLAIAKEGYSIEQQHAFQPGNPLLLRLGGQIPIHLGIRSEWSASVAVVGVSALAFAASTFAPIFLYRLSLALTGDAKFSQLSALLYCLSPAPAVLSVPYTEPFYALAAFAGMLGAAKRRYLLSALCFATATGFRSTGILNAGFLLWYMVWRATNLPMVIRRLPRLLILLSLVVAPFAAFQYSAYQTYCRGAGPSRPWCHKTIPLVYTFVQVHYWDVGFLRYFTVQQLPNFLLAFPILLVSFSASVSYYRHRYPQFVLESIPFLPPGKTQPEISPFYGSAVLPFIHLHSIMTCMLFLASHIQISLRQACTNPVMFWYLAHMTQPESRWLRHWITYTVVWGTISTILWTAFYPPA